MHVNLRCYECRLRHTNRLNHLSQSPQVECQLMLHVFLGGCLYYSRVFISIRSSYTYVDVLFLSCRGSLCAGKLHKHFPHFPTAINFLHVMMINLKFRNSVFLVESASPRFPLTRRGGEFISYVIEDMHGLKTGTNFFLKNLNGEPEIIEGRVAPLYYLLSLGERAIELTTKTT